MAEATTIPSGNLTKNPYPQGSTTVDPWTELSYTIVLSAMVGFVRFNIFLEIARLTSHPLNQLL